MAEGNFELGPVRIAAEVSVVNKPGSLELRKYPLLVLLGGRPGIRTEDNHTLISDIAKEIAVNPSFESVAAKFGTTTEHVRQAVEASLDAGLLARVEG